MSAPRRDAPTEASSYRRGVLEYLIGKSEALSAVVDQLEVLSNRGTVLAATLNALWDDVEFATLVGQRGVGKVPEALRRDSTLSSRLNALRPEPAVEPSKACPGGERPISSGGAGRQLLVEHQAPLRAHALLEKVLPGRQWMVAELMVGLGDYSQRFIAALLGATPAAQRNLVYKPGRRTVALQEELAGQELVLRQLHQRRKDLSAHCAWRGFQVALAGPYARALFRDPVMVDWLEARKPKEIQALRQNGAIGSDALTRPQPRRAGAIRT